MLYQKILRGKIHHARVTQTEIDYMGSISVDKKLIDATNLTPLQEVDIWNVTNGERFSTYLIPAPENSGTICLNGSAARKACPGDVIIIAGFAFMDTTEIGQHEARVVIVDQENRIKEKLVYRADYKKGTFVTTPL